MKVYAQSLMQKLLREKKMDGGGVSVTSVVMSGAVKETVLKGIIRLSTTD